MFMYYGYVVASHSYMVRSTRCTTTVATREVVGCRHVNRTCDACMYRGVGVRSAYVSVYFYSVHVVDNGDAQYVAGKTRPTVVGFVMFEEDFGVFCAFFGVVRRFICVPDGDEGVGVFSMIPGTIRFRPFSGSLGTSLLVVQGNS